VVDAVIGTLVNVTTYLYYSTGCTLQTCYKAHFWSTNRRHVRKARDRTINCKACPKNYL